MNIVSAVIRRALSTGAGLVSAVVAASRLLLVRSWVLLRNVSVTFWRVLRPWTVVVCALTLAGLAGARGWHSYSEANAGPPQPPTAPPNIIVMLSRPAASVTVELDASPSGDFRLGVRAEEGGDYLILFSGKSCPKTSQRVKLSAIAFLTNGMPYRDRYQGSMLLPESEWPVYSSLAGTRSKYLDAYQGMAGGTCAAWGSVDAGTIYYATPYRDSFVRGTFTVPLTSGSGAEEIGLLPAINATGVGESSGLYSRASTRFEGARVDEAVDASTGTRLSGDWFFPGDASFNARVHYDVTSAAYESILASNDRLQATALPRDLLLNTADPATEASGSLSWQWRSVRGVTWSTHDAASQKRQSDSLFFAGIWLAGALSLVTLAFERALDRLISTG